MTTLIAAMSSDAYVPADGGSIGASNYGVNSGAVPVDYNGATGGLLAFRYSAPGIPYGSSSLQCLLTLSVGGKSATNPQLVNPGLTIVGEKSDNSQAFTTAADLTSRPWTTAYGVINTTLAPIPGLYASTSVDLGSVLNELTSSTGWTIASPLTLIMLGTSATQTYDTITRTVKHAVELFGKAASYAPTLNITYLAPAGNAYRLFGAFSSYQAVGSGTLVQSQTITPDPWPTPGSLNLCYIVTTSGTTLPTAVVDAVDGTAYTLIKSQAHSTTQIAGIYGMIVQGYNGRGSAVKITSAVNTLVFLENWLGNLSSTLATNIDSSASTTSASNGTSTSTLQPSVSTSATGDLGVSLLSQINTASAWAVVGTGWTVYGSLANPTYTASIAHNTNASPSTAVTTVNPYFTWTTSRAWSQITATFKVLKAAIAGGGESAAAVDTYGTKANAQGRNPVETTTAIDILTLGGRGSTLNVAESTAAVDTAQRVYKIRPTETTVAVDSVSRGFTRSVAEATVAPDSVSRKVVVSRVATEATVAPDAVARGLVQPRAGAEVTVAPDSVVRGVVVTRTQAEATVVPDTVVRGLVQARTANEVTVATDTKLVANARAGAEATAAVDTVSRQPQAIVRTTTEATAAVDTATRTVVVHRTTAEATVAVDTGSIGHIRAGAEVTAATDTVTRLVRLARAGAEATVLVDTLVRLVRFARTGAEATPVVDTVVATFTPGGQHRTGAEVTVAVDTSTHGGVALSRTGAEATVASDASTALHRLVRLVAESAPTVDSATKQVAVARQAAEANVAFDTPTTYVSQARAGSENTVAFDSTTTTIGVSRSTVEITVAWDTSTTAIAVARTTYEFTAAVDTVTTHYAKTTPIGIVFYAGVRPGLFKAQGRQTVFYAPLRPTESKAPARPLLFTASIRPTTSTPPAR